MLTNEKTLDRLKFLELLYQRGYQSEVIDRALDKLLDIERATANRELTDLQGKLKKFEVEYQMESQDFYRRFRLGELGDTADFVEWSVFYEMWQSVSDRLKLIETERI